jgi:oligo-1,6-glucosidase
MKRSIFILIFLNFSLLFSQTKVSTENQQKEWWKESIVYQIYPRSFKDSDGDGVGDLRGIISKLDYIKSLGVTAIWLNPIYTSPNDDNGYDVSDYKNIMKEFGTMQEFDELLQVMHQRGIKLIMDMVLNHSSDEHEWFKQSRSSRDNKYRNYYHWWPAEKGKPPYRYSLFDVNHDAWMYDEKTNSYYLHYFSRKQPDLNWENPELRKEVFEIMNFWAKKGVDGFRLDAFQFVAKDPTYPEFPKGWEKNFIQYYAMQDPIHTYLKEMNEEVFSKYDVMSVAEGAGRNFEDAHNLVDADRKELNMAYAFDAVDIGKKKGYSLLKLKKTFTKWDSAFAKKGWLSIFLANHDVARMVSRYGNDSPKYRVVSSKMLSTLIMTLRGTPYYYNGDEIGMTNGDFKKKEDFNDVAALNEFKYVEQNGGDLQKFLEYTIDNNRDNGRTPMQWDDTKNAGFSTGNPWLKVTFNYQSINVSAEEKNNNSCLNYFKKLTTLRNNNKDIWVYGTYTILDKDNPDVFTYTRESNGKKMLVLLNFSKETKNANLQLKNKIQKAILCNYETISKDNIKENTINLRPYEAVIYSLK